VFGFEIMAGPNPWKMARGALTLVLLIVLGSVGVGQEDAHLDFVSTWIGDLRVEFHQRRIGSAIVEGDYVLRHYDVDGRLVKAERQWRADLPDVLPQVISRSEAQERVSGEKLFAQMYYIAEYSDVHPVRTANPCWIVASVVTSENGLAIREDAIVDAVTGELLGYAVPPPQRTGFSLTGPTKAGTYWSKETNQLECCKTCSGGWTAWYQSAVQWFSNMGYNTQATKWPTESQITRYIRDEATSVFYELAHGGSSGFGGGCKPSGEAYELTTAEEIAAWISDSAPMPFTFIGSCGGMCETGAGTLSDAFRKGPATYAATVGYCGMAEQHCAVCWSYSRKWQDAFFEYCSEGKTVKNAFELALADYPACAPTIGGWCMRFAGEPQLRIYPRTPREVRQCFGFDDQSPRTYVVRTDPLHEGSEVEILLCPFQWSSGTWTSSGSLNIGSEGHAGGSGMEAGIDNINLAIDFGDECTAIGFNFGEYGGNVNIGVNGVLRNTSDLFALNGRTIGGVVVTVVHGPGDDRGIISLEGRITRSEFVVDGQSVEAMLIIGGQELWVDNVCHNR